MKQEKSLRRPHLIDADIFSGHVSILEDLQDDSAPFSGRRDKAFVIIFPDGGHHPLHRPVDRDRVLLCPGSVQKQRRGRRKKDLCSVMCEGIIVSDGMQIIGYRDDINVVVADRSILLCHEFAVHQADVIHDLFDAEGIFPGAPFFGIGDKGLVKPARPPPQLLFVSGVGECAIFFEGKRFLRKGCRHA